MRNATLAVVLLMPWAVRAGNSAPAPATLTARQVIARIQEHTGVPWQTRTVDTFKAGNPDTPVTGIAVTFSATVEVLRRAAASGKNLIITHEPTFYNHLDTTAGLQGDPVFMEKQALIEKYGLVVWRFHDHWHRRRPDGILEGMAQALGWEKFRTGQAEVFALPATTVGQLASAIRERLKIRTLRVIGNPDARVARAALLPGAGGAQSQMGALAREDVDVVLIGESNEWETPEYARDAAEMGKRKGLIVLGHVASEEAGMEYCARWLKGFVTEVPVQFLAAGEPFWTPK